jgi:hypothetical protein
MLVLAYSQLVGIHRRVDRPLGTDTVAHDAVTRSCRQLPQLRRVIVATR